MNSGINPIKALIDQIIADKGRLKNMIEHRYFDLLGERNEIINGIVNGEGFNSEQFEKINKELDWLNSLTNEWRNGI